MPTLSGWGDVRDWLRTHVFLSTLGPFLIVLHTGFAFGATATWAFACMMMVGGLGVVGLYLYAWIPRTSDGKVVPRERLETERTALAQRVWEMSDAHPERVATLTERLSVRRTPGYVSAVWVSLVYQVSGRRRRRYLAAALSIADTAPTDLENAVGILEQQHRIETQLALAPALGSIYRGWRRVLLPLAVGTLALVIVHIAAVVRAMMGGVL